MATKRRKYKDPKYIPGGKCGKKLTNLQKEMIVQTHALSGNKSQVARECGVTWATVNNVLKEAESNRELQAARTRTLEDMAGKVHGKTLEILDSIGEEDIESGLIKKFDDEGNLLQAKSYGPSLMQKVTSAAILTDKLKVIQEVKTTMTQEDASDPHAMPLPGDIQSALKTLGEKVKSLRILDVQFKDKNPEVANKVQEAATKASLNPNIEEAEYEDLDFDNP